MRDSQEQGWPPGSPVEQENVENTGRFSGSTGFNRVQPGGSG